MSLCLIREAELKAKIKQRKMFLRKLTRMHQMAMTHSAAAARIIEKNDDEINQLMDGKTLRDVISVFPQREEDAYITEEDIGYQPIDFDNLPGKSHESRQSSAKSRSSHHSANSKKSKSASKLLNRRESFTEDKNTVSSKPLPLTLDEIRNKNKIIEAKCLSTFWVNYAKTDTVSGVVAQ
ncbi:hypothetical protein KUTeg_006829 [Tegillarca granosa]|uniref:Uncharacterized protein n=1 Tax=Tegillarca granosa TaxID=220873 RepID=A0ABQ9FBF9_TEGGR|nr:hypothetical protein KUTeg_006829 [Tegillarca granosa]